MVDRHSTKTTKNAKVEIVKLGSPIRLVLYGGAKSLGDNGAFFHASKNVIADYKNDWLCCTNLAYKVYSVL